jgi:hypothetical protein
VDSKLLFGTHPFYKAGTTNILNWLVSNAISCGWEIPNEADGDQQISISDCKTRSVDRMGGIAKTFMKSAKGFYAEQST